jgi:hypothetical protein
MNHQSIKIVIEVAINVVGPNCQGPPPPRQRTQI